MVLCVCVCTKIIMHLKNLLFYIRISFSQEPIEVITVTKNEEAHIFRYSRKKKKFLLVNLFNVLELQSCFSNWFCATTLKYI